MPIDISANLIDVSAELADNVGFCNYAKRPSLSICNWWATLPGGALTWKLYTRRMRLATHAKEPIPKTNRGRRSFFRVWTFRRKIVGSGNARIKKSDITLMYPVESPYLPKHFPGILGIQSFSRGLHCRNSVLWESPCLIQNTGITSKMYRNMMTVYIIALAPIKAWQI